MFGKVLFAQNAEYIIKKNIAARGGYERLSTVKTIKVVGKIQSEGVEFAMVFMKKFPKKTRFQVDLNGQSGITVFNGDSGWIIDPSKQVFEPTVLSKIEMSQVKPMIEYFFIFLDNFLLNYQSDSLKPVFAGTDTVEGQEVFKVKVEMKDNTTLTYFYDTKTYLDIKHEVKFKFLPEPFALNLRNFFTVKDVTIPFIIDSRQGSKRNTRITIDNLQIDNEIKDDLFEMKK